MTASPLQAITILMADDDEDELDFAQQAFHEAKLVNPLHFVRDGQELMEYLTRVNGFNAENAPRPSLILLDLNMPRVDGHHALRQIKASPGLKQIPVVVLTTSTAIDDIEVSYSLGAASYITKPVTFDGLVQAVETLASYWFELATTPPAGSPRLKGR